MEFGFALVPVLAGYWLLTRTHLLKHPYETKTHHRVVFEPAVAGAGLLAASWLLAIALAPPFAEGSALACLGNVWRTIIPFENAAVLVLTVVIALAIPPIVNRKVNPVAAENRWAAVNETDRGRILRESFEQGELVEILLRDGQSHIGIVGHSPRPGFEGDISLAPELSGYRDPATRQLVLNTSYDHAGDSFRIVCLVDHIASISHFAPDWPQIRWEIPP